MGLRRNAVQNRCRGPYRVGAQRRERPQPEQRRRECGSAVNVEPPRCAGRAGGPAPRMTTPSEEKESAELRHSCIGELEHDLHTAFAAKRVPSEDFVHVQVSDQQREDGAPYHDTMLPLEPHRRRPPPPLPPPTTTTPTTMTTMTTTTTLQDEAVTATLNEFCSEATFQEPREPLVLFGPTGCGKSSALANWLSQRRHVALRRSRTANSARSVVAPGLVSLAAVAANAAAAAAVVATPHLTTQHRTMRHFQPR